MRIRAIQEPVFSVANTDFDLSDFEGGDGGHGYGDCIFLVIYAQPNHTGPFYKYKNHMELYRDRT